MENFNIEIDVNGNTKSLRNGSIKTTKYSPVFAVKSIAKILESNCNDVDYSKAKTTNSHYFEVFEGDIDIQIRLSNHTKKADFGVEESYVCCNNGMFEADVCSKEGFEVLKEKLIEYLG